MATRQEIQIALDLIKAVNVPNDLLLSAAIPIANGEQQVSNDTLGGEQIMRNMTVEERKGHIATLSKQVKGYRDKCESFLADPVKRGMASRGLTALDVSLDDIEADIATIKAASDKMKTGAANAKDDTELVAVATRLEADTPALPLVRKG